MQFDEKADIEDVHRKAGMTCADCHKGGDVHGDGQVRASMRAEGAVSATCEGCHTEKPPEGTPAYPGEVEDHEVHEDAPLDCAACHY